MLPENYGLPECSTTDPNCEFGYDEFYWGTYEAFEAACLPTPPTVDCMLPENYGLPECST